MAKPEQLARLAELRLQIDAIDDRLLATLGERAAVVAEIWKLKRDGALDRRSLAREREILERLADEAVQLQLDPQEVVAVFRQVIGVVRRPAAK